MRAFLRAFSGAVLFVAALLLSLPGVRVVRADAPAASAEADAPMCRASGGPSASLQVQRMRALLAARAQGDAGASDLVPLSTRGHGYRGANRVDLQAVERELELSRTR
jgi:hypothetical protein